MVHAPGPNLPPGQQPLFMPAGGNGLWAPFLPPSGLSEGVSPEISPGFGDCSINLNILNLAHFAAIHFNHAKVSCHRTNVRLNLFS